MIERGFKVCRNGARISVLVLMMIVFSTVVYGAQRVRDDEAGVSVSIPSGWNLLTRAEILESLSRIKLPPGQRAPTTHDIVFRIMKYDEPTDRLNPTVTIARRPLRQFKGQEASEIIDASLRSDGGRKYDWVQQSKTVDFHSMNAARAVVDNTVVSQEGQRYTFRTRVVVVVCESDYVWIQMSGAADGPDAAIQEFDAILASLTIDPSERR